MSAGYFIFNGFDTRTTNAVVLPGDLTLHPAREFAATSVMGRSGDILQDNRRYPNVTRSYWVLIPSNFPATYAQFRSALLPPTDYCRLEDSWYPDEHYMAYVSEELKPIVTRDRSAGKFLVTFSRRPERWLADGEEYISGPSTTSSYVYFSVPGKYECFPLVRLKSIGDIGWGNQICRAIYIDDTWQHSSLLWSISFYFYTNDARYLPGLFTDYVSINDYIVIDTEKQTVTNETKGTDLTKFVDFSGFAGGIWPNEHYSGTTTGTISIQNSNNEYVDVSVMPRYYTI